MTSYDNSLKTDWSIMKEMISVEDAQELIRSNVSLLNEETVTLIDAVGRICACDITADIDITPFDNSAMDGYAVFAADLENASQENPVNLKVIAEVPAGSFFEGVVKSGECVRIMTGAAMPVAQGGCSVPDSVVKYEIVEEVSLGGMTGGEVRFTAPTKLGSNVRPAGEEIKAGNVALAAGDMVTTAGVGFIASCGALEVQVYKRPKVAILPIGSELVHPTQVPARGMIRNSNGYALAAQAKDAGAQVCLFPIIPDDYEALKAAVSQATQEYDFVVTSGGACDGDFDFIKPAVQELGELLISTVNMRPGKAQTFGIVNGTPVLGLPGNPAAAYLGFDTLIRPALRKMQGYSLTNRPYVYATLKNDQKKRDPRRIFTRGNVRYENGGFVFEPAKNQGSASFGVLHKSNCLGILPEGAGGLETGTQIKCILHEAPEELSVLSFKSTAHTSASAQNKETK